MPWAEISFARRRAARNMIEVSFDAITGLVMAGSQFDRPIPTLPLVNRLAMVGRGLGRVVAHELGHWLAGRGHVQFGVMKAGFDTRDLVQSIMPLLPPAWRGLLGGAAHARSPRCEPGRALRRARCRHIRAAPGDEGWPERPERLSNAWRCGSRPARPRSPRRTTRCPRRRCARGSPCAIFTRSDVAVCTDSSTPPSRTRPS